MAPKSDFGSGSRLLVAPFLFLCFLAPHISTATDLNPNPNPSISNSVAHYICEQQNAFQETGQIQAPLTAKPENDDTACAWYLWTKCESKSESETSTCPSFVEEACAGPETDIGMQVQKTGRKGKGITPQQEPEDKCKNSTEQGLPDPKLVTSATKYPWLVTIEQGERCKVKLCTGLILNENWVVVMQSGCMYLWPGEKHIDKFDVVAANMKLYGEDGAEQRRNPVQYIGHPGYKPEEKHYFKDNIGVLRVSSPFEFNENVQPINLTAIEAMAPSIATSTLTIAGWTRAQPMKEEEELQSSLIESGLKYFPIDECYDKIMEGDEAPKETLICAGQCPYHGKDQDQPLRNVLHAQVDSSSDSPPVPVGIGPLKSSRGLPQHGVFVNIASYIPWIQEQIKGQGQSQGQTTESSPESESEAESDSESRIVNGEDAPAYKYKSMVNIEPIRSYACSGHICGGIILSEEWFVSAAHCIKGVDPANYKIFVGDHDISSSDENEQVVSIVEIIGHEDYNISIKKNDIAVAKVSPPFKFNDKVGKVTLPDPSFDPKGPLTVIGWGLTEELVTPHILQQVEIPVFPLDECLKIWNKTVFGDTVVCSGNETHHSCKGDSGGPLYHIGESGEQILVGIVSFGNCNSTFKRTFDDPFSGRSAGPEVEPAKLFKPNVFTRVASFLPWIRKNTGLELK